MSGQFRLEGRLAFLELQQALVELLQLLGFLETAPPRARRWFGIGLAAVLFDRPHRC